MVLGIDGSNIRVGGGLTHLKELLCNFERTNSKFKQVVLWSSKSTLDQIEDQKGLLKITVPLLNKSFFHALLWQVFYLKKDVRKLNCDVVFSPGGTFLSSFHPFVSMSQNMLPFDLNEAFRYKNFFTKLRFLVLRLSQSSTFRRADGLIFLTKYAKQAVSKLSQIPLNKSEIISHGISKKFLCEPRNTANRSEKNIKFRFLYVSVVAVYKNQWNVARAICLLKDEGYDIVLTLIGPETIDGIDKLQKTIAEIDPERTNIHYIGNVEHDKLADYYKNSDGFIFASTCENQPIILLEAMSAGLPIACSNRQPMPEVLGNAGYYFDAENVESIKNALIEMIVNPIERYRKAQISYEKVADYKWEDCAKKTFEYLYQVAYEYHQKQI